MSSEASRSESMDKTKNILETNKLENLALKNASLKEENAELCKMIALMEGNPDLPLNVKDNGRRARSLIPPRKPRKASKDPQKIQQCHKIVGEIAFQLDRRILCAVFSGERRLYGYRVAGIDEKIKLVTTCPLTGKVDDERRSRLNLRYHQTIDQLKELGYDPSLHPKFTEQLVNTYGVMNEQTSETGKRYTATDVQIMSKLVSECMPDDEVKDILVILSCLAHLVEQDGGHMFLW
ncbi:speriolin-like [Hyla sarda]|uniref:speriolin-like n=1 Tax=Hyla sarda TaxID=327740 RepID=UPI0024C237A7|nr:speriolin-like [Hyla sarda]